MFKGSGTSGLYTSESPSSRRAWIEISKKRQDYCPGAVALLAEGVDRNLLHHPASFAILVALLAEGVDRNHQAAKGRGAGRCRPPRGGRG